MLREVSRGLGAEKGEVFGSLSVRREGGREGGTVDRGGSGGSEGGTAFLGIRTRIGGGE
jgi:hypothetical protein